MPVAASIITVVSRGRGVEKLRKLGLFVHFQWLRRTRRRASVFGIGFVPPFSVLAATVSSKGRQARMPVATSIITVVSTGIEELRIGSSAAAARSGHHVVLVGRGLRAFDENLGLRGSI